VIDLRLRYTYSIVYIQKAATAERLLPDGGTISVQVLNEVAGVARRKMRMSWVETHEFLELLRGLLGVLPIILETHEVGWRWQNDMVCQRMMR
jgi:predicted nucleic acid-binding protein